eukprot:CAMPEP_0197402056 /NCGR_PEP_ID=MMETSP1165-20131217/19489_1 /TAXON_ID=284809 /ORGANISM="Chrysocystis fragilis, Strain CCMP3189" /LENGTH=101 /DNA_ID=CAMNT_0042928193 /DNA_START=189 /DNA_END=491 /DNA_ORIENTATION=-
MLTADQRRRVDGSRQRDRAHSTYARSHLSARPRYADSRLVAPLPLRPAQSRGADRASFTAAAAFHKHRQVRDWSSSSPPASEFSTVRRHYSTSAISPAESM